MSVRRLILPLAMATLAACEGRSTVPEGEHPAVAYLLPDDRIEVMEKAERLTAYAFGPDEPRPASAPCGERLGRPIVGRVEERDPGEIRQAASDVYEALLDVRGSSMCFNPELGLRFERGARSIEILVSEECNLAWILADGEVHRPSVSIARLRNSMWPAAAAALRRRCGVPPMPLDSSLAGQYHDGILCEGICGAPRM